MCRAGGWGFMLGGLRSRGVRNSGFGVQGSGFRGLGPRNRPDERDVRRFALRACCWDCGKGGERPLAREGFGISFKGVQAS